jgi:hypothetical protein
VTPNFASFVDEMILIKQAESDEPITTPQTADTHPVQDEEEPFRSQFGVVAKERFKNSLKFGLGHGIGTGLGMLAGEKLLPKILPKIGPEAYQKYVGYAVGGLGAISSMALWDAMRQADKAEKDALERDRNRT